MAAFYMKREEITHGRWMKSNVMCLTWVSDVGEMPVISYGAPF